MTEPSSFTTRAPSTIQAMLYNVWRENAQSVKDWVLSISGEDAEISESMGSFTIFVTSEPMEEGEDPVTTEIVTVTDNQYVYLDEDGIHAIDKPVFEMYFKETPA